jgi:beta-glucosidase
VVQLYLRDLVGSTTRPLKQLRGFRRVELAPGEQQTVSFSLRAADMAVLDRAWKPVVEPGAFRVWVGPSSAEGLEGGFEVTSPARR